MASKWDGFSDEVINKFKQHGVNKVDTSQDRYDISTAAMPKRADLVAGNRRSNIVKKTSRTLVPACDNKTDIPVEARLSKPKDTTGEVKTQQSEVDNESIDNNNIGSPESTTSNGERCREMKESQAKNNTSPQEDSGIPRKSLMSNLIAPSLSQPPPAPIDLNQFQTKQKLMEEQNRLRKSFLAKALEDRKKQTHAEQQRLHKIQEELQKLDQRLSNDVSIIRNQIETASLEFMEAQKRYDRAEKEFLDAKLLLYTKLERKELLTHHLCAIIEQNEMRKAQKLSELMEKLNMPEPVVAPAAKPEKESTPPDEEKKQKSSSEIILTPAVGTVSSAVEKNTSNGIAAETSIIAAPLSLQGEMVTSK